MSTTYSLRRSVSDEVSYDHVIINVVDSIMQEKTDEVFDSFNLPEPLCPPACVKPPHWSSVDSGGRGQYAFR